MTRRIIMIFQALLLTLITAFPLAAEPIPTATVSELEPGMKGYGRTVIHGTEIEEFNVEIIGIFDHMGYNRGPLILVELWGDVIDRSGGIAGGYSGSPIFINGKLIGALSWGPYFTEGNVAGVTPINDMLKAFTYNEKEPERILYTPVELDGPLEVSGQEYNRILLNDTNEKESELIDHWGKDTLILKQYKTPLLVSGLSPSGFEKLRDFGKGRLEYLDIIQGPGSGSNGGTPMRLGPIDLEPGASIGAQLVTGDLDLTAVGTLTWVDDQGRFLAFGHPFLNSGRTDFPFVTTEIVHTMSALDRSYKLGEAVEMVGAVTEDRLTTVGGYFGQSPEMVDFTVKITDHDIGRTKRFEYRVINNEQWLPFLGYVIPMEGLNLASDRTGNGTCKVSFRIEADGLENPLERSNLIYSAYDVTYEALGEFFEALNMLTTNNPFRETKIRKVDIQIEVTSLRQTMDIIKARFQNPPNMGPGAVGYTGPEDAMNDKLSKDRRINEEAEWEYEEDIDTNGYPVPEEEMASMEMPMEYNGTETYMDSNLVGYHPGDTVEVLVTLRPFRQDPIEEIVSLKIPDDFPAGQTTLEIIGGANSYYGGYYGGMSYEYAFTPPENLDRVIEDFLSRDTYNTVIIRLMKTTTEDPYFYLQEDYEMPDEIKEVIRVGDVVYGYIALPIEIIGQDGEAAVEMGIPAEPVEGQETDVQVPVSPFISSGSAKK